MNFTHIVEAIRNDQALSSEVPAFDPKNGNERARYLFLLEAPGPGAVKSGVVSFDNQDPTARNLKRQIDAAGIQRTEISLWNIVPWYVGDKAQKRIRSVERSDVNLGLKYLDAVIDSMPNLCCIVLLGGAARQAHIRLSATTAARILSCHHPSQRVFNANPVAEKENLDVLRFLKQTS